MARMPANRAPPYAELQVTTNFSFLRGASHPEELAARAAALGHRALAVTDRNSLAGVVRAHIAAKELGLRFIVGARLDLGDGPSLLVYPRDLAAYGRLSTLLTRGKRRAPKGDCHLTRADLFAHAEGLIAVLLPPAMPAAPGTARLIAEIRANLSGPLYLAAQYLYRGDDAQRLAALAALARACATPLVATNDIRLHDPARKPLLDVLTAIRLGRPVASLGRRLLANAERHPKPPAEMARLFAAHPDALRRTIEIAAACRSFSLDVLRYDYPVEAGADGEAPQARLARLTEEGARARYPAGVPEKVRGLIAHELALIARLASAPYFLTVHDIVAFARARGILCQGRGSAANSAVCYCLGITAVDPDRIDVLFERFISEARNEPPDIDVDFEHERREEVIQHIYERYGRDRAGLAASVITYRARSALHEVGKALGLSGDALDALSRATRGRGRSQIDDTLARDAGFDPQDRTLALALALAREIEGFPRHLSQHVGGFVITRGPLHELSPIANAAMADRTTIEWDKDDLDALGILKIDVLGLGMLTCIRKAFALIEAHHGRKLDLASVPAEDPAVYDMLCAGDAIGVFQVESRAQMAMLPRLKPRCFYDLVIEVAIVRPGPIQGNMVHPYLRRRSGKEAVVFPSADLRGVLGKTLGVPLFQEQAMHIAIIAAGFTASEADALRRAMATFRRSGKIQAFRTKMVDGMMARGYARDFAERCFDQIEGFGEYGFPESHAASFALLVYVSAWLKRHYPAAFAGALLNSQPMGFYAPAQIVRDARDHGVDVRPVDVNRSAWDCTLEDGARDGTGAALRLGFRQVKGLDGTAAARIIAHRRNRDGRGYATPEALMARAGLGRAALETLAHADTMGSMGLGRRQALWAVRGLRDEPLPLFAPLFTDPPESENEKGENETGAAPLPPISEGENIIADYATTRLSLRRHPLALLRQHLEPRRILPAGRLSETPHGTRISVAGLVIGRQRPGTAKGIIFVTLEDETGIANLIVRPHVFARFRRAVLGATLLAAHGRLERRGRVIHVLAERARDFSALLQGLARPGPQHQRRLSQPPFESRDFR